MKIISTTKLLLSLVLLSAACSTSALKRPTLKYSLGINTSEGFTEILPAGQNLPTVYSETYSNQDDHQDVARIEISQKRPEGSETIVDVDVPIPGKAEGEVEILLTLKIDVDKMLRVKASVMDSGLVKEYGPFPVE